jgi:hypothetical protein
MNYKGMFQYFMEKYLEMTGHSYYYLRGKTGLELMKIKRLKLSSEEFIKFIDWLQVKKKLASINFLPAQLNDYFASVEYRKDLETESLLLHYKLMAMREIIVGKCEICNGVGRINDNYCSCMEKFMLIRKKIRGI